MSAAEKKSEVPELKPPARGVGHTLTLKAPLYIVALCAVLFLTACNGLFDALDVEYGGKHSTFLFAPSDRHADLIKSALSFPPFTTAIWPHLEEPYASFYTTNPYGSIKEVRRGGLTSLHVSPLIILTLLMLKRAILWLGPVAVVYLFYASSFACLALIALRFCPSFMGALTTICSMALSYPFLMILSRGNYGALVTTACLMSFVYELLIGRRVILAALLLALAFNCRPNVVLFAPLFLIFGWRDGLRALLIFGLSASIVFATCDVLAFHFYEGYSFSVFRAALHNYYESYVINSPGVYFNSSAYGAAWAAIRKLHLNDAAWRETLVLAQMSISAIAVLLLGVFGFCYLRRRIDKYEYAFAVSALYILGSTILATYHLFFLFVFILVLARRGFELRADRAHYFILIAAVLMLVPKNYVYRRGISFEVYANPLLLAATLILIAWRRSRPALSGRFWDTLHWEGG